MKGSMIAPFNPLFLLREKVLNVKVNSSSLTTNIKKNLNKWRMRSNFEGRNDKSSEIPAPKAPISSGKDEV
jgi:hypothetical protein